MTTQKKSKVYYTVILDQDTAAKVVKITQDILLDNYT